MIFSEILNFLLILSLVTIQSVVGVGILVVGTPLLLIFDFSIIDTMNYLLPISIITSFLNLIIMSHGTNSFYYDLSRLKFFFIICVPSVFIGLFILKKTYEFINYDYFVSLIIIFTLIFKKKISIILKNISNRLNKIILMTIGIIHGLTNSGGTLLSILLINLNNTKNESRSEITLFYFFLALLQFLLIIFIFGYPLSTYIDFYKVFYIIIGVGLGNIIIKYVHNSIFKNLIFFLAFISSVSLIIKSLLI